MKARVARAGPVVWPYLMILLFWFAGTIAIVGQAAVSLRQTPGGGGSAWASFAWGLVGLGESVAWFYLLGFLAKSATYWASPESPGSSARPAGRRPRRVAVLYLTAGDFDATALDSLLRLRLEEPGLLVVHDDGDDLDARLEIAAFVSRHPRRSAWEVVVWHRPHRAGGKAGAVNWVLGRLDPGWELLLLCDSDSLALDADSVARAAGAFDDRQVAVVQFRNVGYSGDEETPFQKRLANAINVFDVFASAQSAWGYVPFFGHNALLRIEDLRRAGGLTPGFFSDDLDLSARLSLAGRRIVYRHDVAFGERHPGDFDSFRRRARKWSFGCMQVIRVRARDVLTSPSLPLAHRIGLLEFMGFYPAQALLLAALVTAHLVLPALARASAPATLGSTLAGGLILVALLAPTFAWSLRERKLREWPLLAWSCALVYGGSLLATVRGVLDGFSGRERPWIPTNTGTARRAIPAVAWAEMGLGLALMVVPWLFASPAVQSPASYLFVSVFLFSPITFAAYQRPRTVAAAARRPAPAPESAGVLVKMVLAVAIGAAAVAAAAPPARAESDPHTVRRAVETRGDRLYVDGRPLQIRGIHYSPWLPGTGPMDPNSYPGPRVVDSDFDRIERLGANTVLVHEAPAWVLDRAQAHHFNTIYALGIAWNDTSRAAFDREASRVVSQVDSVRAHGRILAFILGNEVPVWVDQQLGHATIENRLRSLAARVRAEAPGVLIGHENWPPTKDLDLGFMDLICFNLYPAWPYEVTVKGYGPYLREVLEPIAKGKPLLISEFGINSLEAGEAHQAQVITDCWKEIASSRTIGGVVFSWADEWWKNYDNPIPGKGYWERAYDPTDASRHDNDPEEYYGIVRADRVPKPAYAAVAAMWGGSSASRSRSAVPWFVLGGLGVVTWFAFGLGKRPRRGTPVLVLGGGLLAFCALSASTRPAFATWSLGDTLTGQNANDQFGWGLSGTGDFDGDHFEDAAIGARFFMVGADSAAGAVYVYRGGQPPGAPYWLRLEGLSPNEHFGESAASDDKDVDGDGYADLAVGAPLRSTNGFSSNGSVDLFRGGPGFGTRWTTLSGEASDDWFGQSVALGDLDGDGKAEIIVGAPYNDRGGSAAGAVFIYHGGDPISSTPWKICVGQAANDQFGWSVAYLGDVNGDGYGDFAVGARLHGTGTLASAGEVYVFYGGPNMDTVPDAMYSGEAKDDWFGNSVAGPGDVDGHGRADLLVGAPYNDRGGSAAGAAYLFRGEDPPGSPPAAIYVGEIANAQFGWSVSGAGDVNGDGLPDVLVGARMQPVGALSAAGRIYLFPGGSPLATTPLATADGEAANDWFGNAVGAGRGYFYPGHGAVISGAPYNDAAASAAGRAYVLGMGTSISGVPTTPGPLPSRASIRVRPNPAVDEVVLEARGPHSDAPATIEIFDVAGRRVRTLDLPARSGSARWDLLDEHGRRVPPGIFLVRTAAGSGTAAPAPPVRIVVLR